jgi:hypothetical protein
MLSLHHERFLILLKCSRPLAYRTWSEPTSRCVLLIGNQLPSDETSWMDLLWFLLWQTFISPYVSLRPLSMRRLKRNRSKQNWLENESKFDFLSKRYLLLYYENGVRPALVRPLRHWYGHWCKHLHNWVWRSGRRCWYSQCQWDLSCDPRASIYHDHET